MNSDKWIIDVRKQVTKANPNITVAHIVNIFSFDSPLLATIGEVFDKGGTPKQAFKKLIKVHGKECIGL